MALPPWTIELLRRGLSDVARKAREPQTLEKIKTQATEILQDLPETAARGIDAVIPSAEAGKKSVERWSRKHTALAIPMLNASGVLLGELGTGVPLNEQAIEVGRELFAGDVIQGELERERLVRRLQRLLPVGGDYSIAITSNFSAAITAFSLLIEERVLVVHRAHAVRLPNGLALPDAFGMLMPVIAEVGSNERVEASDFDGLDPFCAILADAGDKPIELLDLSGPDAMQAVVLPVATLAASEDDQIPSAETMLQAGADFVIMSGDGICGGPECGILIGRDAGIERICNSASWPALQASDAVKGMMLLTLEIAASAGDQIPVRALLHTSEENLRSRAERMATRLTGCDKINSCQITADDARLTADGRWRFPSRQLRLRHASMSAEQWAGQLRNDVPAIDAIADGDDLRIDLRWVAASDDHKLAEAIGSPIANDDPPSSQTTETDGDGPAVP